MKAVVFDSFGSPGKVLRLEDQPLPEPGPGQVRLRLVLSPMHNHDEAVAAACAGHRGTGPRRQAR